MSPARDPQFRAKVWARIEAARQPASWPRFVRSHPAAIAAGLTLAVALGALTGREQAQSRGQAESDRIATNYVNAMDARLMRLP